MAISIAARSCHAMNSETRYDSQVRHVLRRIVPLLSMIALALGTSGCGGRGAESENDHRAHRPEFRWISTELLDLDSHEGTFVRAVTESVMLARLIDTGVQYPGFDEANLGSSVAGGGMGNRSEWGADWFGTMRISVIERSVDDYGDVSITVCRDGSGLMTRRIGSGTPPEIWGLTPVAEEMIITRAGGLPHRDAGGALKKPAVSPFGGWQFRWKYGSLRRPTVDKCRSEGLPGDDTDTWPGWSR